jgi:hypothetical protein
MLLLLNHPLQLLLLQGLYLLNLLLLHNHILLLSLLTLRQIY